MHSLAGIVDAHFPNSFRTCGLASALSFLVFTIVVFCALHKLPCKYLYMFVCIAVVLSHIMHSLPNVPNAHFQIMLGIAGL